MRFLARFLPVVIIGVLAATQDLATPLGTGFSFQGQLIQSGTPFTGTASLRFSLWDAAGSGSPPTGGTMLGTTQVVSSVSVTNGLFVVQLNAAGQFGPNAFNGDARWLQVEVCNDPTCSTGTTVLAPRQPINPVPYSSFSAGPWQMNGLNVYFTGGNVGIGTGSPISMLHVAGNATLGSGSPNNTALTIPGPNSPTDPNSAQDIRYSFASAGSSRIRAYRGGSWDTYLQFLTNDPFQGSDNPQPRMTIDGSGNVGIGTTAPAVKLDVMGDIYLGSGHRYTVPGAEEDIKMVRGSVNSAGTPLTGCCYVVSHPTTGEYDITLSTPFTGVPSYFVQAQDGIAVNASIVSPTSSSFRVLMATPNTLSWQDDPFYFVAIGPR